MSGNHHKQNLGKRGEDAVAELLVTQGFEIVERNWRSSTGEIDLIVLDNAGIIHFVEVKTRSSLAFGHPLEAISAVKAHRLHVLARQWLRQNPLYGGKFLIDCAAAIVDKQRVFTIDFRIGVL